MKTYQINPDMTKMQIPKGDHDFDYVFTITLTNNAMLRSVTEFQVHYHLFELSLIDNDVTH